MSRDEERWSRHLANKSAMQVSVAVHQSALAGILCRSGVHHKQPRLAASPCQKCHELAEFAWVALVPQRAEVDQLRTELEASALAAEKLFEQRDTAIAEATKLRAEVGSAWENLAIVEGNLKAVIEQVKGARDTAIRERDDWRKTALGLDEYITTQNEAIRRLAEERDQAIADLKAFGGEVGRLYEAEREAERMRKVVEAAQAWRSRISSPPSNWADDEDFALIAAVDATKEASDG